jgi:ribulose-5-phosphate 4-epimerase/fuculose-1-phosphate aldolase
MDRPRPEHVLTSEPVSLRALHSAGAPAPGEAKLRRDLAALYRLAALEGWTDSIFNHYTVRIPGEAHHFLINPYGWLFEEITASSLVKIDLDGRVIGAPQPVNSAGFFIHSAIHRTRADAQCVMHLHTLDGTAVAAQEDGLLPITQHALGVIGDVAYIDYGGAVDAIEEGERLAKGLGDKSLAILRNHGTLAVGRTCADVYMRMYYLERACSHQVRAQGRRLRMLPANTLGLDTKRHFEGPLGEAAWPALLRRLDRIDPSYAR